MYQESAILDQSSTSTVHLQNTIQEELAEREEQLQISSDQYLDLQGQLEYTLQNISKETGDVRSLEQELREGGCDTGVTGD